MKTIFVLFGLIAICLAQSSLQNLQQIMNGAFAQAGLAAPTQAINCFDESDATTILDFTGTILTQVSKEEIFSISGTINKFKNNFPSSVLTCLKNDPEMTQLQTAYHVSSSTFTSDPIEYVLEHLGSLKSSASTGASDYNSGDYEALGTLAGQMVQQYVSQQSEDLFFSGDALTDVQQILNGFFAQGGLAAPTQAINCFDESDATTALNFVGTILTQVSKEDIFSISGTINNFKKNFPSSVLSCLKKDPEMAQLETAYHLSASTFTSDPIEYVIGHLGSLKSSAKTGSNDFNSGDYEALGTLAGQMVQQYVSQQSEDLFFSGDALTDVQQILNGFFAQGGLAAPTQAINCFDESDATTALNFVGTILTQVSKEDIFSISGTINNFKKNFPSSVLSCLKKDSEMAQLEAAYHLSSSTFTSDPIEYVLGHLGSLKSSAKTGSNDFNSGDYEALGTLAGQMVQQYVSQQSEDLYFSGDALTDLQQILDGVFSQAGLAAPTQAINCFDESDATTALNFAGTILTQVSKEDIFSISGTISKFKNNFPSSVLSCLKKDSEMTQLQTALHLTSSTFSSDPIEYVLTHLGSLKSSASTGANDFNSGDYEALGTLAGQMIQQYVGQQSGSNGDNAF